MDAVNDRKIYRWSTIAVQVCNRRSTIAVQVCSFVAGWQHDILSYLRAVNDRLADISSEQICKEARPIWGAPLPSLGVRGGRIWDSLSNGASPVSVHAVWRDFRFGG